MNTIAPKAANRVLELRLPRFRAELPIERLQRLFAVNQELKMRVDKRLEVRRQATLVKRRHPRTLALQADARSPRPARLAWRRNAVGQQPRPDCVARELAIATLRSVRCHRRRKVEFRAEGRELLHRLFRIDFKVHCLLPRAVGGLVLQCAQPGPHSRLVLGEHGRVDHAPGMLVDEAHSTAHTRADRVGAELRVQISGAQFGVAQVACERGVAARLGARFELREARNVQG
mmetsp:Transcript_13164/g.33437  ORF Transcript_13164/g.33437 Transcript_13164/m.33437 type:complete len:231 (-) Transcript_13164:243-935(-)